MLLEEITNPTKDEQSANLRNQKLDKQAMSLAGFLKKHPKLIPSVSKLLGVPLAVNKGLNTNKDGSVVYESLTEAYILSDLYGLPHDLLIEGRPEINAVILDFCSLEEGVLDNVKKVARGAKAVGSGAVKATKATARTAKALSDKVDKAGKLLGDTKPVDDFSEKIESLVYRFGKKLGPESKAVETVKAIGSFGKEHPKKTAFLIAAATGVLAAGSGAGVALPVGVALRTALGMAKGEKFKVAFGKAAKMAGIATLVGGLAGAAGEAVASVAADSIGWDGLEMQQLGTWLEGKYQKIKLTLPGDQSFEIIASGQQAKDIKMYQGNVSRIMSQIEGASPEDLHARVIRYRNMDWGTFHMAPENDSGAPVTQADMNKVYSDMQSGLKEQLNNLNNALKKVTEPGMQGEMAQKIKDAGELIDVGKRQAAVADAMPAITKSLSAALASGLTALKGAQKQVAKGGKISRVQRKNPDGSVKSSVERGQGKDGGKGQGKGAVNINANTRATYKEALGKINAFVQKLRPQEKQRLGAAVANLLK